MGDLTRIADVVRTASGEGFLAEVVPDLTVAVCRRCGQTFDYEAEYLPFGEAKPRLIPRQYCDACSKRRADEQDLEQRQSEFDRIMASYRDNDRGSRLAQASFAEFTQGPHNAAALRRAVAWVEEKRRPNLLVVGPIGSGKSYLAACVHNAVLERMEPSYWVNVGTLMAQIRRGFSDRDRAEESNWRIERAGCAPLLVLDDLGKVHPGKDVSWVEETFYAIVDERYRNELPTIVTTEWKSATLAERVGESVVSRLEDGAWVAGLKKPETPYRRTAA